MPITDELDTKAYVEMHVYFNLFVLRPLEETKKPLELSVGEERNIFLSFSIKIDFNNFFCVLLFINHQLKKS